PFRASWAESHTLDFKLARRCWGPSNALSLYVFDYENNLLPVSNPWDGSEQVYSNAHVNMDGGADSVFGNVTYGPETYYTSIEGDGVTTTVRPLWLGIPNSRDGDITTNEFDQVENIKDDTVAGLVFDTDFSGRPEMFAINVGNPTVMHA